MLLDNRLLTWFIQEILDWFLAQGLHLQEQPPGFEVAFILSVLSL